MGAYTGGAEEPDGKPNSFAIGAAYCPKWQVRFVEVVGMVVGLEVEVLV